MAVNVSKTSTFDRNAAAKGGKGVAKERAGAQHERAGREGDRSKNGRLYRRRTGESSPAARPSYTVSPVGQRVKRSRPTVAAERAANLAAHHETRTQAGAWGP